jgi:dynein heavy chain
MWLDRDSRVPSSAEFEEPPLSRLDPHTWQELFMGLPVVLVRAVTADKAELKDAYRTPVYKTERRFREEVFTAQLKSKHGENKWTLSGVCLFLDVVV